MSTQKQDSVTNQNSFFARIMPSMLGFGFFLTSLLVNLGMWMYMYFETRSDDFDVPLHYDIYNGITSFGRWSELYIIPVIGLVLALLNYILSIFVHDRDELVALFLNASAILIQIILLVALFWIFNLQNEISFS